MGGEEGKEEGEGGREGGEEREGRRGRKRGRGREGKGGKERGNGRGKEGQRKEEREGKGMLGVGSSRWALVVGVGRPRLALVIVGSPCALSAPSIGCRPLPTLSISHPFSICPSLPSSLGPRK